MSSCKIDFFCCKNKIIFLVVLFEWFYMNIVRLFFFKMKRGKVGMNYIILIIVFI